MSSGVQRMRSFARRQAMRGSDAGPLACAPRAVKRRALRADDDPARGGSVGDRLRIVSANLWNGRADADAFAELVASLHADVVAVQELGFEQAEALACVLPHGRLQPDHAFMGMGIAMRRPGEVTRIPLHYRDAWRVVLDPGAWPDLSRPLEVINLHVAAPHTLPLPYGLLLRRRQLRDFERHLATRPEGPNGLPQALVGDLNATPAWPAYQRISAQWSDAATAVARRQGRAARATWGPGPGARRVLRIDHGFVRGLAAAEWVEDFQVVAVRGSDHSAIVMDLRAT
jgi:endonuclease/exonuclease/phosphatase family metal-dependent hydrolase